MSKWMREFIEAARASVAQGYRRVPSYEETAAILGSRYQELETPFGVIGYLGPLELPGGDMGASAEYCDV